jgi:hypothetical protein
MRVQGVEVVDQEAWTEERGSTEHEKLTRRVHGGAYWVLGGRNDRGREISKKKFGPDWTASKLL